MDWTLASLFQEELDGRRFITGDLFSVEDIFDQEKLSNWYCALLGVSDKSALGKYIHSAPPQRLMHTASTYLLGCAVQRRLGLRFPELPRILSGKHKGNAFHFFWAIICLSHDLGYNYEQNQGGKTSLDAMDDPAARQKMFSIGSSYDLMELEDFSPFNLSEQEKEWCEKSLRLMRGYDRYRREKMETIDHGIAGGILLYSFLMEYAVDGAAERNAVSETIDSDRADAPSLLSGELRAYRSRRRFRACALLAALTVARHNMWHKNSPVYNNYGLEELKGTKISGENPLNRMLLFLDYMDTIDPYKCFYMGSLTENPSISEEKLKTFLFQQMQFSFEGDHVMQISIPEFPVNDRWKNYCDKMPELAGWLDVARPESQDTSIRFTFPMFPGPSREYPAGITEDEIYALFLYEGSGDILKAWDFYQIKNAYQTFNLLMMPGIEGEKVRIGFENQRPHEIYIRDWPRTLKNMEYIFQAQCKYASSLSKDKIADFSLFRVDRRINFSLLKEKETTYAFTSTSQTEFLSDIAEKKKDVVLLDISLNQLVPFADYYGIFEDDYVFMEEAEVLLPPFLSWGTIEKVTSTEAENAMDASGKVEKYTVSFGKMCFPDAVQPEECLRKVLNDLKEKACETLTALTGDPSAAQKAEVSKYPEYVQWKEAFQELVGLRFQNIWKDYQEKFPSAEAVSEKNSREIANIIVNAD